MTTPPDRQGPINEPFALVTPFTGSVIINNTKTGKTMITLNGETADVTAGGAAQAGTLILRNRLDKDTVQLDAGSGAPSLNLPEGTEPTLGKGGHLTLRSQNGSPTIYLDGGAANLYAGGAGQDGDLIIRNGSGIDTVHIDGNKGDILLMNADCAEEFDLSEAEGAEPGTVMVLDGGGDRLKLCNLAYDKRVAGVVSGAGDYRPGIILDRQPTRANRVAVALVGKAYCKVDATHAPIEVGDLLTTSSTPGHAMKAVDPWKAFGAVIGKALQPVKEGRGLVPILIALQ